MSDAQVSRCLQQLQRNRGIDLEGWQFTQALLVVLVLEVQIRNYGLNDFGRVAQASWEAFGNH